MHGVLEFLHSGNARTGNVSIRVVYPGADSSWPPTRARHGGNRDAIVFELPAMKALIAIILTALFVGCAAGGIPGSGVPSSDTTFARAAVVSEPMLTCTEATHAAVNAVRTMGYTVSDVKRASAEEPGLVIGVRELGYAAANPVSSGQETMKVRVTCSDAGSSFEAVSDEGGLAQLNFSSRFSSVVKKEVATKAVRLTRPAEEARGLIVTMEPTRPSDALAIFGDDLSVGGVTPVKIAINNRSDRRYSFSAEQVTLVTTQGKREKAISADTVASKAGSTAELATKLRKQTIAEGEIAPGESRSGYLYFRASTYRNARVTLTDIESEEPEGFSIGF